MGFHDSGALNPRQDVTMLAFIDESYRSDNTDNPKTTFGAVLIERERYRDLDKGVFELKQHFFKVQRGFDLDLKGRFLLQWPI